MIQCFRQTHEFLKYVRACMYNDLAKQDTVFAKSRDEYVRPDCPTIWAVMCLLLQKWTHLAEELRRNCGDLSLENDSFHAAGDDPSNLNAHGPASLKLS